MCTDTGYMLDRQKQKKSCSNVQFSQEMEELKFEQYEQDSETIDKKLRTVRLIDVNVM